MLSKTKKHWTGFYDGRTLVTFLLLQLAWVVARTPAPIEQPADLLIAYSGIDCIVMLGLLVAYVPRAARWIENGVTKQLSERSLRDDTGTMAATEERIRALLQAAVILDSNIWMNPSLDDFFSRLSHALKKQARMITLFGPQLDEICNIKDRAAFASKKGRLARLALARIEALQSTGSLRIDPLVLQADPKAYADPLILQLIARLTQRGQNVHFVSDDRELRIRSREISSQSPGKLEICTSRCFLKQA